VSVKQKEKRKRDKYGVIQTEADKYRETDRRQDPQNTEKQSRRQNRGGRRNMDHAAALLPGSDEIEMQ